MAEVNGTGGSDVLTGTSGDDTIYGAGGLDDLQGLGGDDLYIIKSPDEHPTAEITDTSGFDTVEFQSNTPGTLILYAGDTGLDRIRLGPGTLFDDGVNIDAHLVGNGLDIVGGAGANTLIGTAFSDTINGAADPDRISGGLGSDVLTGGTGYDTFADTAAGLNGDTITDFANYDSIVITDATLAGFSFSLSGNTLTYTGGSLTLGTTVNGQIVARTAVGGGVELTIGPALVPAWPAPPGPPNTGPIIPPESSYSIGSGEYRYMATQFSGELFAVSPDTLTNAGTIYMEDVLGFYGDMRLSYGHMPHFYNSGTVVVHAHTDIAGNVLALQDNGSDGRGTDVTNSGQIFVVSDHYGATFLLSWSTNTTLQNSGLIAAYAPEGTAAPIELFNNGHITNLAGGEILAEGQSATGILAIFDVDLTNAGVIAAWSLSGSPSVGVFAEVGTVTNSGTISGDISVYIDGTLTNSGTLNGAVLADSLLTFNNQATGVLNGNFIGGTSAEAQFHDIVINVGLINGDVILNEGDDSYNGTGGSLHGVVDAGAGNDTVIGWFDNDVFYGDDGDDTLTGNGGDDFIEGGAGNDVLSGGAGFDTAAYSEASAGVTVSLAVSSVQNTGGAGNDTLTGFEDLVGSEFADQLTGTTAGNFLFGLGGNDVLTGGLGADILTGESGNDTFRDTKAGLSGDTIVDFAAGDKIVLTDAALAGFSFSLTGHTLSFTGGSLTLTNVPAGTIVASAAAGGGVQLTIQQHDPDNDFNGDGRSDVLWRNDNGAFTEWLAQPNGGFVSNDANAWTVLPTSWHISGTGDFNGDGRDDVLWRNDAGAFTEWLAQPNGGFVSNDANAWTVLPTSWHVQPHPDWLV